MADSKSPSDRDTEELADPYEDDELLRVIRFFESSDKDLVEVFGNAIRRSIDAVIDTASTGRWRLDDCGNVEKAYLGYKVENLIRAIWHFGQRPKGMDYVIDGVDVDCKWSKSFGRWMIPREAVGQLCLLTWADDNRSEFAIGLIRAHAEILTMSENQGDKKRQIQAVFRDSRTHWLVPRQRQLPPNFLLALDEGDRRAILGHKGGDARAKELFIRCEGIVIDRHTIESVGQQRDDGRRFRGETRDSLQSDHGLELLNGHWKADRQRASELSGGLDLLRSSRDWISLRTDGSTPDRLRALGKWPPGDSRQGSNSKLTMADPLAQTLNFGC